MDLVVLHAIENVCNEKVNYDTSMGYFSLQTKNAADLSLDEADVAGILNEIEYMSTVRFDKKRREKILDGLKGKRITVADFIRKMETQSLLVLTERVAERNSAAKPKPLNTPMKIKTSGTRCFLTEEKCDKIPKDISVNVEEFCLKSNCKIAKNFFDFVERMR